MEWYELVITSLGTILASSGLWAFIQSVRNRDQSQETLLKGLAYSGIVTQARYYIQRGWITPEEYSDFYNLIFVPYKGLGGNGSAERIMREVDNLPLKRERNLNDEADDALE